MDPFTRISVPKAHEIIASGKVTILDIRDAGSFAQGHIAHAQNVNDGNIDGILQTTDKATPLICYCYHGISSQQASRYFSDQGFKQVYSIDGGWEEWKKVYG